MAVHGQFNGSSSLWKHDVSGWSVICALSQLWRDVLGSSQCYDDGKEEWNVKMRIPILEKMKCSFKACALRIFKGTLENLEPVDFEQ